MSSYVVYWPYTESTGFISSLSGCILELSGSSGAVSSYVVYWLCVVMCSVFICCVQACSVVPLRSVLVWSAMPLCRGLDPRGGLCVSV